MKKSKRGKRFFFFVLLLLVWIFILATQGLSSGPACNPGDMQGFSPDNAFHPLCVTSGGYCQRSCSCRANGQINVQATNIDCLKSASMADINFDDGGVFTVNGHSLSNNCDDGPAMIPGFSDDDFLDYLKESGPGNANFVLSNVNSFAYGISVAGAINLRYGQPDDDQILCSGTPSCDSICTPGDGGPLINGRDPCDYQKSTATPRKWIGDAVEDVNKCCGDDIFKMTPLGQTDNDNPDRNEQFCKQCPVMTPGTLQGTQRQWMENDPNAGLNLGFNKCCGDDPTGIDTSVFDPSIPHTKQEWDAAWKDTDYDSPDMSQTACQLCPIGSANAGLPASRSWDLALMGPQRCCGDDPNFKIQIKQECSGGEWAGEVVADNPDNSEEHCLKCPSMGTGDLGPGSRIWGDKSHEDPRNFPPDQQECNMFGSTVSWEGVDDFAKENNWADVQATDKPETVGCCGDDSAEQWCNGFTGGPHGRGEACENGKYYVSKPSDSTTVNLDESDHWVCETCVQRVNGHGVLHKGHWRPMVGPFGPLVGTTTGGPGITPTSPDGEMGMCCGDDPGENWCMSDQAACYSKDMDTTDSLAEPDVSEELCLGCAMYGPPDKSIMRDWNEIGVDVKEGRACCGDDYDGAPQVGTTTDDGFEIHPDCLLHFDNDDTICGNFEKYSADGNMWAWEHAGDQNGNILYAPCDGWWGSSDGYDIVSYGEHWAICLQDGFIGIDDSTSDNPLGIYLINGIGDEPHDYLCVNGAGPKTIHECCGASGNCNSDGMSGVQHFMGDVMYVPHASARFQPGYYYCTSNGTWDRDLDRYDEQTCLAAKTPDGNPAGFIWTGTYCCGELDDVPEFYNDVGSGVGACWNSKIAYNGNVTTRNPDTGLGDNIVDSGEFFGCAIDQSNFNKNNDGYVNILDTHKADHLIRNKPYCTVRKFDYYGGLLWCSYQEEWKYDIGAPFNRSVLSTIPWIDSEAQISECCPADRCWIGKYETDFVDGKIEIADGCIQNMSKFTAPEDVYIAPDGNPYRCLDGHWTTSPVKTSPFGLRGYCPTDALCLRDPNGKNSQNGNTSQTARPACLYDGQYKEDEDFLCRSGEWYSRTAKIAEEMAKISTADDFAMTCGPQSEMLNFISYTSSSGDQISEYLKFANNGCVVQHDGLVAIGFSLKKPANTNYLSFLEALGKDIHYCDAVVNDGAFHACSSPDLFYNKQLNSVIYSPAALTFTSTTLMTTFVNEINYMKTTEVPKVPSSYGSFDLFKSIRFYNYLYINKKGSLFIAGVAEAPISGEMVLGVSYSGTADDLCKRATAYNDKSAKIYCEDQGQKIYILNNQKNVIGQLFPQLTYKLRTI